MTMKTSDGSFAFTDGGLNISSPITDKFRVGAQMYIRNVGHLGNWEPELDWAVGDCKFKDWFGIRGGKVKTTFGLHNDTQDMDFLHTFALLPQSIYPVDLRDSTIAHIGADVYGEINLKRLGSLSYTVFGGKRQDSMQGGYAYFFLSIARPLGSYGGPQIGEDLRWNTPVKGLLVGASHMDEDITGVLKTGVVNETCRKNQTSQFYAQYTRGNFRLEGEYRRYWRDQWIIRTQADKISDGRSFYVAASYRVAKHLELGTYHSRYMLVDTARGDLSLPQNHVYDTVATARIDLTSHWNLKVEGHFIDGYGANDSVRGFYTTDTPSGLKPRTNLLIVRTGWNF
jgi:hypothetical protein